MATTTGSQRQEKSPTGQTSGLEHVLICQHANDLDVIHHGIDRALHVNDFILMTITSVLSHKLKKKLYCPKL